MENFTDLLAWKTSIDLVKDVYRITRKLPKEELFGLTSQLRRASVSIAANIAEGFGRYTFADKANKYVIARGECAETETLLRILVVLGFIDSTDIGYSILLAQKTGKLTSGLIASCRKHRSHLP